MNECVNSYATKKYMFRKSIILMNECINSYATKKYCMFRKNMIIL